MKSEMIWVQFIEEYRTWFNSILSRNVSCLREIKCDGLGAYFALYVCM